MTIYEETKREETEEEIECQLGTKTIIYNKPGKYVKVEYGYWNGWFILPREEFYEHVSDFSEWLEWYAKEE